MLWRRCRFVGPAERRARFDPVQRCGDMCLFKASPGGMARTISAMAARSSTFLFLTTDVLLCKAHHTTPLPGSVDRQHLQECMGDSDADRKRAPEQAL